MQIDEIVSVKEIGNEETYDLTVDHPDHTFFANNISVSNSSHATAYAIDSYWCAWLLKYHEEEWLSAYLESMSNNPDNKAAAFGYVRQMGYEIIDVDINHATSKWTALPGKKFMPSLMSVKAVGMSAIDEVMTNRPYKSIDDMLWNADGTWRHGKLNKRALDALIKVGAFESLNVVGSGKLFENYRHMWETLCGSHTEIVSKKKKGVVQDVECVRDHSSLIKRSTKADPFEGMKTMYDIARSFAGIADWTIEEKAEIYSECFGTLDATKLIDPKKLKKLTEKNIQSIDHVEAKDIYWFTVTSCQMKKTKNGKSYALIKAMGPVGKEHRMNVWGANKPYEKFSSYVAEIDTNDFGMSSTAWKVKGPL